MYVLGIFSVLLIYGLVPAESLNLTLYYESLCPDSVRFIKNQLGPSYNGLRGSIDVSLVPFGFANADKDDSGAWQFTCQHGPNECYGNKVQSCALSLNAHEDSLAFVICAMSSENASEDPNLSACAESTNISWDAIVDCVESGIGDELLVANGNITNAVQPPLSYVPTLIFDNVYNETLQGLAEFDFQNTVCDLLLVDKPDVCL